MLETERLLIRKFTPDDLGKLIELRSDDEVIEYLGGKRLQNPENIAKRLQAYLDSYEKNNFGVCAMIWKETGEMIGWSGLQPLEETGETEVGYGMIKEFWGRGIGFECASAWLKYGLSIAQDWPARFRRPAASGLGPPTKPRLILKQPSNPQIGRAHV